VLIICNWRERQDFVSDRAPKLVRGTHHVEANMFHWARTFLRDESGATAIEYGLIAALIAVAIIAGATAVGGSLSGTFNTISTSL
jgi:pilus assembly protein Flp/PilA